MDPYGRPPGCRLEHVRDGFSELDAGSIDEFELDDLIHRYKRAAADLWKFCGTGGAQVLRAADALKYRQGRGEIIDWWAQRAPRPRGRGPDADAPEG